VRVNEDRVVSEGCGWYYRAVQLWQETIAEKERKSERERERGLLRARRWKCNYIVSLNLFL
jgi:hypothetical protein